MKRFLRFEYDAHYPLGGTRDLVGAFDTLDNAKAPDATHYYVEILDVQTGEVHSGHPPTVDFMSCGPVDEWFVVPLVCS